jgi:hypothetical protein
VDKQAAKEYAAFLQKEISRKASTLDELSFIPTLSFCGYFLFSGWSGAVFGGFLGWAVSAIFLRINALRREIYMIEFSRHLHEFTDETEAGIRLANVQIEVEKVVSRRFWKW